MKNSKNIDHLYLRKFKDVETTPPDMVWENISSRLPKKERKSNLYPFWVKFAGAAAILALLLNLGLGLYRTSSAQTSVATYSTRQNIEKEIILASTAFNENMFRTSMLLQGLMQDRKETIPENELTKDRSTIQFTNYKLSGVLENYSLASFYNGNSPSVTFPTNKGGVAHTEKNEEGITSGKSEGKDLALVVSEQLAVMETSEDGKSTGRLSISTKVAPVYFDYFGSGSALGNEFSEGGGEVSLSYGVNLAYEISKKIKVRSGINKVDLSYNTRGVGLASAVMAVSSDSRKLPVVLASSGEGSLNRSMGFIEIPLEIEYVLIDEKLGLNLIGGASSLFLDKNSISFDANNSSTYLGQAHNLNNLSFSANLGFGLNYEVLPQFQLNLEPIFKYQLNTFDNASGLNPYYFGVYSGFSFSF